MDRRQHPLRYNHYLQYGLLPPESPVRQSHDADDKPTQPFASADSRDRTRMRRSRKLGSYSLHCIAAYQLVRYTCIDSEQIVHQLFTRGKHSVILLSVSELTMMIQVLNSRVQILGGRNTVEEDDIYFFNIKAATSSPTILRTLSKAGAMRGNQSTAIEMNYDVTIVADPGFDTGTDSKCRSTRGFEC